MHPGLKQQLQCKLQFSRTARACDLPECGACQSGGRSGKICVVENIEQLRAELNCAALSELYVLEHRHIIIDRPRVVEVEAPQVPEYPARTPQAANVTRIGKCGAIDVRVGIRLPIAIEINRRSQDEI